MRYDADPQTGWGGSSGFYQKRDRKLSFQTRQGFWREAFAVHGSITPQVLPLVLAFGLTASVTCGISWLVKTLFQVQIALATTPFEFAGAALGLLLVLRTNAGYERWSEARKLWGGIVNQSRNLAISAMAYGPTDSDWREEFVRWAAVFSHLARLGLRGERTCSEVANLVGPEEAHRIATTDHLPSFVALKLGNLLREAREQRELDPFAFMQVDRERALLIDHIGACERILKTPLPRVYSIKIRRFIVMFLLTLPFALLHRVENFWLVPLITMLVAYPLLSLDQIGVELENPFSKSNLSHLPLDDISATIERNLLGVLKEKQTESP
ncbi:bestrophin family ion channel [soil metagenome]